jgi:hypothetical protein
MRRKSVARRVLLLGVAVLVLAGASVAYAARPEREPYTPDPTVLGPGQACDFNVEITQEGNYTQTTFADGRVTITGSGQDTVTNLDADLSLTFRTSGKITTTELANGDQRLQASGRTVFYFFEGDQGPFGPVGEDGALYYLVGHVDETLDPDTDFTVTSFEWSGRATELCSLISP